MASSNDLHGLMKDGISQLKDKPKLVGLQDGARLVNAMARLLLAKQPPSLIVVDLQLDRIGGQATAVAIRALERGADQKKVPMLLYGPDATDADIKSFCKGLGSTVHLRSHDEKGREEQAQRLLKAIERVLDRKKGKAE